MRTARTAHTRRHRALRGVAALGALVAALSVPGATPAPAARATAPTFTSPFGVVSRAVLAQNRLPGTTAWRIAGTPPGLMEGFANTDAATAGQLVTLYVSTTAATWHVEAYRMGWYQGTGAHLVWRSASVPGRVQPPCALLAATRTTVCDTWSAGLRFHVGTTWPSGDYLLKLVGNGRQASYVLLTVWDPASTATYLLVSRTLTEQGWNTFGGADFYQGTGACAPGASTYPPCNRAYAVSLDRPQAIGLGASDFLTNEFPLVSLMERHGLDATYVSDITLSEHPGLASHHRAILSLGHDETWTAPELFGVEAAQRRGVNVVFFGAAALVRHARLAPGPMGPNTLIVDYRDSALDPLNGHGSPWQVTGNTWAAPPTNWSATSLVGELYAGYVLPGQAPAPLVLWDAPRWLVRGTPLHRGSSIPGIYDSDIDHVVASAATPATLQVLGHSPIPLAETYTNQGAWAGYTYGDFTYHTDPASSAGVIDTGTTNWICALSTCAASPAAGALLSRLTTNILALVGAGPAGRVAPPVPNAAQVVPFGS